MPDWNRERYLSLRTFRKTGVAVDTPVWFAEHLGKLYVFSAKDAGKVKRIRNSSKAEVAACNVSGRVHGDWQSASASVVDSASSVEAAYTALRSKYGLQMWLTDLMSKLSGRYHQRAILEIEI